MYSMKKVWIGLIAVALIAILGWFFFEQQNQKNNQQEIIKVGVVLPLTGNLSFIGDFVKNSLLLVRTDSVEFIFEDCGGNPKDAVTSTKKLIEQNQVASIISVLSFLSESVNSICENKNVKHFIFAFSPSLVEKSNIIRPFVSSTEEAKMIVSFINEKKMKKVAFLRHIEPDAEYAFKNTIQPMLNQSNVEIVDLPFNNQTTKDFKNDILKLKNSNVELVIIQSLAYNISNIMSAYTEYSLSTPILGDINFLDIHDDVTKEKVNNIPFIGLSYVLSDEYSMYANKYLETYNIEPFALGACAFDLVLILKHLVPKEKQSFISNANSLDIKGVTGKIQYNTNGDQIIHYTILKYENNHIVNF
jgi:ABC-type branched-chain amino acid transport systems, periplasmic component